MLSTICVRTPKCVQLHKVRSGDADCRSVTEQLSCATPIYHQRKEKKRKNVYSNLKCLFKYNMTAINSHPPPRGLWRGEKMNDEHMRVHRQSNLHIFPDISPIFLTSVGSPANLTKHNLTISLPNLAYLTRGVGQSAVGLSTKFPRIIA